MDLKPAAPALILASTSPYRKALLERLGPTFRCVPPDVDEEAFKKAGVDPRTLAERLAAAKAAAVAERFPDAVVIGSDQTAALDGERLGKPGTEPAAVAQLLKLTGRTHELFTAVCIRRGDRVRSHCDTARLTMRPLGRDALARYVARDRPLDCAGSYKIEAAGVALFERIDTADFTAIVGLPLLAVVRLLAEFGVETPSP